jgi:UDP-4-amino-4,6-dideoxy-N-acetyl-beta-L-altrosamine transaminase
MIPYGKQSILKNDIDAVVSVLQSDWLTQGPAVPIFEEKLAKKVGVKYGVAVNSATSALHIACLALDLGKGDWLWTSPNTFVASANCGLYCGAQVDFVDIDSKTFNMSVEELEKKLIIAKKHNKLPKIVIPVHFSGQSCDMKAIFQLSQQYGFKIIEDASHAIGGSYEDQLIGNCTYSHITIFSFHPVKIITTGEGGMAVTNDSELAQSMRLLRSHGITRNAEEMHKKPDGPWYYEQIDLGFNYRMTDIQAALGASQLDSLDYFIDRRRVLAIQYNDFFKELPIQTQQSSPSSSSSHHLYVIRVQAHKRLDIFNKLRAQDIGVNVHYIPVHLQPAYHKLGFSPGQFPQAESYYYEAISLPIYANLTKVEQEKVMHCVFEACSCLGEVV